jgi:hypothetical protein
MFTFATLQANDTSLTTKTTFVRIHNKKAFTFVERGIKFRVFLSGNFTYTNLNSNQQKRTLKVYRNTRGMIYKIGTVPIYYNSQNQFTRIGSVRVSYRNGSLSRIGSLLIRYDSNNRPSYKGRINSSSGYYSYTAPRYGQTKSTNQRTSYYSNSGSNYNYNHRKTLYNNEPYDYYNPFFYRSNFTRDYVRYKTDNHFIYYRAKRYGKATYKTIKRRVKRASNQFKTSYKDTQKRRYNDAQIRHHNQRDYRTHSNTYSYYTSFFYNSKFKKNYIQYKIDDTYIYYKARKRAYVEESEQVIRRKRKGYKKGYSPSVETKRKRNRTKTLLCEFK